MKQHNKNHAGDNIGVISLFCEFESTPHYTSTVCVVSICCILSKLWVFSSAVVTGAGQRVHEMGTWMAPIVFSLAMQTWKSMNTSLLRLDQQMQRGREKIVNRSRPRRPSTLSNVQSLQPTTGDIDTFNNRTQLKVTTSQNAHQVSHQDAGHNDFVEGK